MPSASQPIRGVLMIDDNPRFLAILCELLEGFGFVAEGVPTAEAALARLADSAMLPSLLILDLYMPGMDGWAFLNRLPTLPAVATLPVVLITGWGFPPSGASPTGPNVVGRLEKPFRMQALLALVGRYSAAPAGLPAGAVAMTSSPVETP